MLAIDICLTFWVTLTFQKDSAGEESEEEASQEASTAPVTPSQPKPPDAEGMDIYQTPKSNEPVPTPAGVLFQVGAPTLQLQHAVRFLHRFVPLIRTTAKMWTSWLSKRVNSSMSLHSKIPKIRYFDLWVFLNHINSSSAQDDGWLMGIKVGSKEKGVFPENFTKRID
jgi:hypothetical protein